MILTNHFGERVGSTKDLVEEVVRSAHVNLHSLKLVDLSGFLNTGYGESDAVMIYEASPGKAILLPSARSLSRHAALELSHHIVRKPKPHVEGMGEFVGFGLTAAGMNCQTCG